MKSTITTSIAAVLALGLTVGLGGCGIDNAAGTSNGKKDEQLSGTVSVAIFGGSTSSCYSNT